jgi:hypothetical protein
MLNAKGAPALTSKAAQRRVTEPDHRILPGRHGRRRRDEDPSGKRPTMNHVTRFLSLGLLCGAAAGCTSTSTSAPEPLSLAPTGYSSVGTDTTGLAPQTVALASAPAGQSLSTAPVADDLYYIEFRARSAESYGHTFAMFGRRDAQGNILTREVAGLHPASTSDVPYVLGHLIPVPSETGPSDGDLDDRYMTANYRIDLNRAEYENVLAYIRQLQSSRPLWHAALYNCNSFVGDIAKHMGLRAPSNHLLFPEQYITTLREMNAGRRPFGNV